MNKTIQRALLTIATLAPILSTGTAFAAAGDALKWSMGISAGYAMTDKPIQTISKQIKNTALNYLGETKSKVSSAQGFTTTISLGYAMSDNIRFGFGIGYSPKLKIKNANASIRSITGVATAYYDFVNDTMATPFVSLGLGMQSAKLKNITSFVQKGADPSTAKRGTPGVAGTTLESEEITGKKSTIFRGEVGAGIGFKVSDGVHLELAYKLANTSRLKATEPQNLYLIIAVGADDTTSSQDVVIKSETVTKTLKPAVEHSLSLGVRFNF